VSEHWSQIGGDKTKKDRESGEGKKNKRLIQNPLTEDEDFDCQPVDEIKKIKKKS